jgi:hypothetical protein
MSLRNVSEISNVKLMEVYPLEINVQELLSVITKKHEATTGWDLVQLQLDDISLSMNKIMTLSTLSWRMFYSKRFKSLSIQDNLLAKYIPSKEDINNLRNLVQFSSPELVEAFNKCFPSVKVEKQSWVSEDDVADENLESLISYYECFPQYDGNYEKMKLLKVRLSQRK